MAAGETAEHRLLKELAARWARDQGYRSLGSEISLPHCGYRADLAAYRWASELRTESYDQKITRKRQAVLGHTAVFECKQARADLVKDSHQSEATREQLRILQLRRQKLERLLKVHYPAAGLADSLFPEFETFDFSAVNHRGHTQLWQKITHLQSALLKKTKFEKMVRYRCANLFYLVLSHEKMLLGHELPLSWGLLVKDESGLRQLHPARWVEASEGARLAVLQRIASSAMRTTLPSRSATIVPRLQQATLSPC